MKKIVLFASIFAFAGTFISCNNEPESPTKATPENTMEALLHYVPYELGQVLEFVNDSLGREWKTMPCGYKKSYYDPNETPFFPNAHYYRSDSLGDYRGRWHLTIEADLTEDGTPMKKNATTTFVIEGHDNENTLSFGLISLITLSQSEKYEGFVIKSYTIDNFHSSIGDTIRFLFTKGASEGCYINVVKDKGITDFCVDGKTTWRRVK